MKTLLLLISLVAVSCPFAADAQQGDLYVYPAKGQNADQQERDRYDCYLWATRETGFDPAQADAKAPADLVRVPIGKNEQQGATLAGTVIGAIAGAAIGSHNHGSGTGAVVGATVGTIIGAGVEQSGQQQAEAEAGAKANDIARQQEEDADRYSGYRRAFSACLEGRGYVVR